MQAHAKIQDKKLSFETEYGEALFYQKFSGKSVTITDNDEASANLHRFYRGAVLYYIKYQHASGSWKNLKDLHIALKKEFAGSYWTKDLHGNQIETVDSFTGISKRKFRKFLDKVLNWMSEQHFEVCDSEAYHKWIDSAPPAGEEYPPLRRLRETYEMREKASKPWRI